MSADMKFGAAPDFADLPGGYARVVLADPPWSISTYSRKGWKKSAHAHYPCMRLEDIKALPVAELCQPDAVCVLWMTQVFCRNRSAY